MLEKGFFCAILPDRSCDYLETLYQTVRERDESAFRELLRPATDLYGLSDHGRQHARLVQDLLDTDQIGWEQWEKMYEATHEACRPLVRHEAFIAPCASAGVPVADQTAAVRAKFLSYHVEDNRHGLSEQARELIRRAVAKGAGPWDACGAACKITENRDGQVTVTSGGAQAFYYMGSYEDLGYPKPSR